MSSTQQVSLHLTGMTCASCANRIEKKLNKLDGVEAVVNYATEKAQVTLHRPVPVEELVAAVEAAGYGAALPETIGDDDAGDAHERSLRQRLVVAALLGVPVILVSMLPALQFPGWQWVMLALSTPVVWWCAWPFHAATVKNLRHGSATMDTLVSLGTVAAYAWSIYALLFGHAGMIGMKHGFEWRLERSSGEGNIYFEAAAGIIVFLLLGRWLEARAKSSAGSAVRALLSAGAKEVTVLRTENDGSTSEVRRPVSVLAVGDRFVVRPGEKIASDGVVLEGSAAVDNSLVTGESVPVQVGPGAPVVGGCLDTDGRLVVRATAVGSDTQLAHIARLVEQAQTGKAGAQRLADRISGIFVPVVVGLALATLVGWLVSGAPLAAAIGAAVAVLIVACPCALGLATPTALLVGTGRGAQLGIVIKGPEALERSGRIDTIVLDKTGTVTTGAMAVADVHASGGTPGPIVLAAAAAVEAGSEHPIARAVVAAASTRPGAVPTASGFRTIPGGGIQATVDGELVTVGSPRLVAEHATGAPDWYRDALARLEQAGQTPVVVAWGGQVRGVIGVADTVKPTSAAAVAQLRELGLRPVLLTGDHEAPARQIAAEVGIDDVIAGVLPQDKAATVARLQGEGRRVAMAGDGVNDAAALAQADLGIAMGTGTDAAIEAADLTLVRGDLAQAPDAVRLARATLRTINGNLFWAFGYNVVAIPLAALGFLTPMLAGAFMAFSSVFVVTNSLRLRTFS